MTGNKGREVRIAAFFDVDGTLVDGTIVNYYVFFRRRLMPLWKGRLWLAGYLLKCLYYLVVDRFDRTLFNVLFYRDYAGLDSGAVKALAADCHNQVIAPRLFEEVRPCLAEHHAQGHQLVAVTGSIGFIIRPLADDLGIGDVLAPTLVEHDGYFTGALDGPPLSEVRKAVCVREFAESRGIDLSQSHAYGDSVADLPMLETVGFPHAVNPDKKLTSIAQARGWPVHRWSQDRVPKGSAR